MNIKQLLNVSKPVRYIGGELNSCVKNNNGKSLKQKVIFLVLDLSTENFFVNFFSKKSYNKRTRFVET